MKRSYRPLDHGLLISMSRRRLRTGLDTANRCRTATLHRFFKKAPDLKSTNPLCIRMLLRETITGLQMPEIQQRTPRCRRKGLGSSLSERRRRLRHWTNQHSPQSNKWRTLGALSDSLHLPSADLLSSMTARTTRDQRRLRRAHG